MLLAIRRASSSVLGGAFIDFGHGGVPKVNHKTGYGRVDNEFWITIRSLGTTPLELRKRSRKK